MRDSVIATEELKDGDIVHIPNPRQYVIDMIEEDKQRKKGGGEQTERAGDDDRDDDDA